MAVLTCPLSFIVQAPGANPKKHLNHLCHIEVFCNISRKLANWLFSWRPTDGSWRRETLPLSGMRLHLQDQATAQRAPEETLGKSSNSLLRKFTLVGTGRICASHQQPWVLFSVIPKIFYFQCCWDLSKFWGQFHEAKVQRKTPPEKIFY